ncbi:SMC family ATPase, partial [Paenibacillus oryzisoli]|uniref:AAA family ATPase n=1 Tax=Paenibacillus oryzisoli TaxID=1850517 RepID=UPI003D2E24D2
MRPVQLQMSGLQSYRELQTIDFSRLIDAGVFGIFGPTGSGKSSILDAITLALYGKVERASGGTQAIMNHAETALFVSFTFELTNAAGSTRYKVERQFKRGTELSINGTIARLVRIADGETVVLADKAGEVNQQVQHILGLSMQDFTRAVVLPQGKFAEFLTLTGKDRRQMLQRLFHLESYGDQLSQKVSSRVKETDSSVKQLAAEQQGLGDASAQAMEDAKRKLEEAEQAEAQSRHRVAEQERVYEEHKLIHGWQSDAEGLESQQRKLQESEPSIKEKEVLLQLAEKAQQVQPFLAQHALAVKEIAAAEAKQLETADAHKQAELAYTVAAQAAEQAQQELSAQEGPLLLRLDQLEQARVLAQELSGLQQQMQTVTAQRKEAGDAWDKLQAEIAKSQETKQKALVKQADLKAQLGGIDTNAAVRQTLQAAVHAKRAIEQQNEQKLEAESHQAAKQQAFEDVLAREAAFGEKRGTMGCRLASWRGEAVAVRERMQNGLGEVARQLAGLQTWLDEERKRWKQRERQALAELLASELQDGEACPVCGSLDHPAKGGHDSVMGESSREDDLQLAEQLLLRVREGQYSAVQLDRKQASLWQEAVALGMRWENNVDASVTGDELLALREAAAGHADLEEASVSGEPEAKVASVAAWQRVWQAVELELGDLGNVWEQLEASFGELQRMQRTMEQEAVLLQAQKETALAVLEEAKAKASRIRASMEVQRSEWTRTYAGLDWQQADQQLEGLLANERLAEELRGRIEKSVPFLEELQASLEALQRAAQEQDRLALQLDERLQGLAQLAADKTRQLEARTGGADVAPLIAEATAALERLRRRAQATKLAHASAQAAQSQAAQRASAAAEAAAAAARQLAQA